MKFLLQKLSEHEWKICEDFFALYHGYKKIKLCQRYKNVKNTKNMLSPPLHIKFGVNNKFIKIMHKDGSEFF